MPYIVKNDVYTDFLALGTFKDVDNLVNDTTETMWNNIKNHPNFDEFWQERDARTSCYNLKPAILVVGGLYDSEDCYGAWGLYRAIRQQSPDTELYLAFGPWWHGAWTRRDFQGFGNVYFGKSTSAYYMDHIQYPFFRYYLENEGEKPEQKVSMFYSGKNEWEFYDKWPIDAMQPTPYYIHADVQKWLGSLYSVGVSDSAVNTIAEGLNLLGTGNVTALNSNESMQTLMAMSASKAGVSYADILTGGLDAETTNKLLKSMVEYLQSIANNTDNNQVTKSAYANLFGISATDIRAISNLTQDDVNNISKQTLNYSA